MMKVWRSHARLLASLLLIASPAVGGTLLPLAHPCPVDAPWLAEPDAHPEAGAGHHGHHVPATASSDAPTGVPAGHDSHTDCSCIGMCAAPAVLLAPRGVVALAPIVTVASDRLQWPVIDATDNHQQLLDLLPPTTAPPLV